MTKILSKEYIETILNEIPDPEIPVISIVDLGIVRKVILEDSKVIVHITPTYSGCPAMMAIQKDIVSRLNKEGIEQVEVKLVVDEVWTTDWINEEARERLRQYGIAPPEKVSSDKNVLMGKSKTVSCPRCGSEHTVLISQFGSTACKALYRCENCREPFDYFKCH
ncbi:MAG TPA: phenylacetate-CoA oxygenase subunit PaaJ [Bacteroidia bacterium]|nr:phenylacetate-CoA oxygenase subunit PaaJ [Bacteroidia bacterium]HNP98488.1 phenylacetate-CoA oxygenase subunit PaaJ [Bacteroidia bacterium]